MSVVGGGGGGGVGDETLLGRDVLGGRSPVVWWG
jgi:hypothetical protein